MRIRKRLRSARVSALTVEERRLALQAAERSAELSSVTLATERDAASSSAHQVVDQRTVSGIMGGSESPAPQSVLSERGAGRLPPPV